MLEITIPAQELFDDHNEIFIQVKETTLQLEHSLISVHKWEKKWHVPFLGSEEKTDEQIRDYIRCMTLNKNIDPKIYYYIPPNVLTEIFDYIENPMTATWFSEEKGPKMFGGKKEIITAEIVYYWMVTLNIPVQFEKWHLNSLLTLIRVINIKNTPPKKMSKRDTLAQYARLNAERRKGR